MAATLVLVAYFVLVVALWLISCYARPLGDGAPSVLFGRMLDALLHCALFVSIYVLTHDWRILILTYLFSSRLTFRTKGSARRL
jgi:hypothetical protein